MPNFDNNPRNPNSAPRKFPYTLNRRWEVVDRLNSGGMGTVYMARDLNLSTLSNQKKQCVVKELKDDHLNCGSDKEMAQEFFLREVHVLADLDHQNIVRVLDQFREDDKYYLVMEYVEGQNLHEMLMKRGEPFDEKTVIKWAITICNVLKYLHTHNPPVIYRDLKPSNIMINTNDQVKLVDFGIARPFESEEDNTQVVSQGYSPPEQYWGHATTRSDIYALGATMHFLLTGQDPLALTVSEPKKLNSSISDHINEIVMRATQQEASARYPGAEYIKNDLEYVPPEPPSTKGKPLLVVISSIVAIGMFLGGLIVLGKLQDQQETRTQEVKSIHELRLDEREKKLAEQEKKLKQIQKLISEEMTGTKDGSNTSNATQDTSNDDSGESTVPKELTDEAALTDTALN